MSEIREEFDENLLDHNKVPIPSPQPGDMVFSYYTGSPGLVLENLKKNKSKVLWGEYGPSKENNIASKDLRDFLLETFGQGSYTKKIGGIVYNAPLDFIKGLGVIS